MKRYKVAFISYDRIEPSSGIGNVCKQFNEQLGQFEDIKLVRLTPPRLHFKPASLFVKILNKLIFLVWYNLAVPLLVFMRRVDIYVELNMLMPPRILKKVTFFVYDLAFLRYPNVVNRRNFLNRIRLTNNLINYSCQYMAISEATKSDLVKYAGLRSEDIFVCYLASMFEVNSINQIPIGSRGDYFLFVGTIEPRKNIIELVKAFYLFIETTNVKCKLIMIGKKGWLMDDLDGILGLDSEKRKLIEFIGYVDNQTLSRWYGGARALLFPSLYEGFGLPILEAMAHHTPVITCRNSSLVEVGGEAVLYTEPDYVSISHAMQIMYEDAELASSLVTKGKAQMLKFSWENFGKSVHKAILKNLELK